MWAIEQQQQYKDIFENIYKTSVLKNSYLNKLMVNSNKIFSLLHTSKNDVEKWQQLGKDIEKIFPRAPFSISCVDDIAELDETFTDEQVILILDDRCLGYYFDDINPEERTKYFHYTVVKQNNNQPITLKDVIQALIDDTHYWDEFVMSDPHCFLEMFDKSKRSNIQYTMFWGS